MSNQRDPFAALWNFLDGDAWLVTLNRPIAALLKTASAASSAQTEESGGMTSFEPELSNSELSNSELIETEIEAELNNAELNKAKSDHAILTGAELGHVELGNVESGYMVLIKAELNDAEPINTELLEPEPLEIAGSEALDAELIDTEWRDINPHPYPPEPSIIPRLVTTPDLTPVIEIQYDCDGRDMCALQSVQPLDPIQAVDYVPDRLPDHPEIITLGEPFMNDRYDPVYDSLIRSLARRKQEALAAELGSLLTAIQHQGYSYADLLGAIREILAQQAPGSEWNDCLHDLDRAINSAQRAQGLIVDAVDQLEDRPRLEEGRDRDRREWSNNPITS